MVTITTVREARVQYVINSDVALSQDFNDKPLSSALFAEFFRQIITTNSKEHFLALYLDSQYRPISYQVVSIGSATMAIVQPNEIFQQALLLGASALIVCHNHPSGKLLPSREDDITTKRLCEVGEIVNVKLLDHLIISETDHTSYHDQGWLSM